MSTFTYEGKNFLLDGKPYTILSGAVHYFRTVPEYWEDRLTKLKACGFNTVETYTCWNLHERREGQFDFSGILDIERFISIAEKLELNVIIRPGPYICAEWEFGGLPSWLLKYPNIALRCNDPVYLSKVEPYYKELLSRIRPHLITNGGRVIMVQVENEYGSYGNDKEYLRRVVDIYRENGIDCMLFTSDGTIDWMLGGGTLPEVLSVANFGSRAKEQLTKLYEFQGERPLMCGEFWSGWYDHWYDEEHRKQRDPAEVIANLEEFAEMEASFNFYMFVGGTNFGFTNGASHPDAGYQPDTTSYDYAAPLTEAGDLTPLYYAIRESFEKRTGVKAPDIKVENTRKAAYGKVTLEKSADLFENLSRITTPIKAAFPKTMEEVEQDFGYILYRTTLRGPFTELELLADIHDRAIIFLDGKKIGIKERSRRDDKIVLSLGRGEEAKLDILVENTGRVNYGPRLLDRKGIIGGVRFGMQYHFGWEMYPMTMDDLSSLAYGEAVCGEMPAFYSGTLNIIGKPADTFIKLDGFTKGFVKINGFNLGRYFNPAGPQKTLYVPAPVLKEGENEIVVFESDGCESLSVEFLDAPIFS